MSPFTYLTPPHRDYPGNGYPATGSECNSQVGFSMDSFHPKPGSNLHLQKLPAQSSPKDEADATAPTWGYTSMPQPFIFAPRAHFCMCAKSVHVLPFKSLSPSCGISLPGGREGALHQAATFKDSYCTYTRNLLSHPGEQQKQNIPA